MICMKVIKKSTFFDDYYLLCKWMLVLTVNAANVRSDFFYCGTDPVSRDWGKMLLLLIVNSQSPEGGSVTKTLKTKKDSTTVTQPGQSLHLCFGSCIKKLKIEKMHKTTKANSDLNRRCRLKTPVTQTIVESVLCTETIVSLSAV